MSLISFVRDGRIVWKAMTGYGSTIAYLTQDEARLAGLRLIEEAQ